MSPASHSGSPAPGCQGSQQQYLKVPRGGGYRTGTVLDPNIDMVEVNL